MATTMKENLSEGTGLQQLQEHRLTHHENPLIDYLNINSLRNKTTDFRVIIKSLSLDYFILSKTKIGESFRLPNLMLQVMKSELRVIEINKVAV